MTKPSFMELNFSEPELACRHYIHCTFHLFAKLTKRNHNSEIKMPRSTYVNPCASAYCANQHIRVKAVTNFSAYITKS